MLTPVKKEARAAASQESSTPPTPVSRAGIKPGANKSLALTGVSADGETVTISPKQLASARALAGQRDLAGFRLAVREALLPDELAETAVRNAQLVLQVSAHRSLRELDGDEMVRAIPDAHTQHFLKPLFACPCPSSAHKPSLSATPSAGRSRGHPARGRDEHWLSAPRPEDHREGVASGRREAVDVNDRAPARHLAIGTCHRKPRSYFMSARSTPWAHS